MKKLNKLIQLCRDNNLNYEIGSDNQEHLSYVMIYKISEEERQIFSYHSTSLKKAIKKALRYIKILSNGR